MSDKPILTPEEIRAAKPRKVMSSHKDLMSVPQAMEIEYPDYILVIPIKVPSWFDWLRLGYDVPIPQPPVVGGDKRGPIVDRNDAGYLKALEEAANERTLIRLLAAIDEQALDQPLPGNTPQEKLAAMKEWLGAAEAIQIATELSRVVQMGEARVIARTQTFRGNGPRSHARIAEDGLD